MASIINAEKLLCQELGMPFHLNWTASPRDVTEP